MLTLLPTTLTGYSKVYEYMFNDSQKWFEDNLKTQPNNWRYRTQRVEYHVGSHGYRCPEFEDINWSESVVLFGCSQTYGIGLDESETLHTQLSKLIDRPVINLGLGASSVLFALMNQVRLQRANINPYAVINIWTSFLRMPEFKHNGDVVHLLDEKDPLWYANFVKTDEIHQKMIHKFYIDTSRSLWKDTKHLEFSTFRSVVEMLDIPWIKKIDDARDTYHIGKDTVADTVQKIAQILEKA